MTWAPCPHGVRTRGKKARLLGTDQQFAAVGSSHRAEPILKSVGKASATMPASRKQQSGKHPFGCAA